MDLNDDINILVVPSFTELVNPFRAKLSEIVTQRENKDKIFIFTNIAEYGGSGVYTYDNRRDYEPGANSIFTSCDEGWRAYNIIKKDEPNI